MEKVEMTETQKAAEDFSRLTQKAGHLAYQIDCLQAELGETYVKMRNANTAYNKAKKAETPEHIQEVTDSSGVTQ
jgi:hypothetical protein